jgi:hypothetical protein
VARSTFKGVLFAAVFAGLGLAVFGVGFLRVVGTADGIAFGVMFALLSASAWAASTVLLTTILNLFAALFAADSAGFLATPDKVCAWHHLPLLCP